MPSNATWIVSSGRPSWPYLRATSPDSIAPTVRCALRMRNDRRTGWRRSSDGAAAAMSSWSSAFARPWSCASQWLRATSGGICRLVEHAA